MDDHLGLLRDDRRADGLCIEPIDNDGLRAHLFDRLGFR